VFDSSIENFNNMDEVNAWLKDHYGTNKRAKMYRDDKDGNTIHIGYIYGFHNDDVSHYPINKWIQQDWVSFYEIKPLNLEV
jgi:hypothetical protein